MQPAQLPCDVDASHTEVSTIHDPPLSENVTFVNQNEYHAIRTEISTALFFHVFREPGAQNRSPISARGGSPQKFRCGICE